MAARTVPLCALAVLTFGTCVETRAAEPDRDRAAFSGVRWSPEVRVDGRWYALRSIDGVPVEQIIDYARKRHGDRWDRRFAEDLVELLTEMGRPPGAAVRLVVRDPDGGPDRTLDPVPLTRPNREAVKAARHERDDRRRDLEVTPQAIHGALDALSAVLNDRWSYRRANDADFDGAIAALRKRVDAGIAANDFGVELQKVVALGIDGHAGVSGYDLTAGGCLPFLVETADAGRAVTVGAGRSAFLADGFPYLTKIDGRDLRQWTDAAAALVPKGSPQYVRRHSLTNLRYLGHLRRELGLANSPTVVVELAAKTGDARTTVTLPVARTYPPSEPWPRGGSRVLDGNVGYLRVAAMDDAAVRDVRAWMPRFRDSAGLVVDVRDNGGGSREPLLVLYSYLAAPTDPPRVFTAAAYRLHPQHRDDHLSQRFMYRAGAEEWTEDERRAVAAFARTFRPEWDPPKGQFSDWHYMALTRREEPGVYHYDKPVIVLMNARCFSATDIFLYFMKGMRNFTILFTTSVGVSSLLL